MDPNTFIPAWVSNYIHCKLPDKIIDNDNDNDNEKIFIAN